MDVVAHRRDGEEEIAVGRGDDVAAKDERLRAIMGDERLERAGLEIQLQQTFGLSQIRSRPSPVASGPKGRPWVLATSRTAPSSGATARTRPSRSPV